MPHLPNAHQYQHNTLTQGPPQHSRISTVTDLTETLLTNLKRRNNIKSAHMEHGKLYIPFGKPALWWSVQFGRVAAWSLAAAHSASPWQQSEHSPQHAPRWKYQGALAVCGIDNSDYIKDMIWGLSDSYTHQLVSSKPPRWVGPYADCVLPWFMRGEREPTLGSIVTG